MCIRDRVSEVIIKHTIVKKHINPFIEQVIETHAIESFTNYIKNIKLKHINKLYDLYKIV